MAELQGIAHVCLKVSDLESVSSFYEQVLGLQKLYDLTYGDVVSQIETDRAAGTLPPDITDDAIAFLTSHADEVWSRYLKIVPGQFLELFASRPGDDPLGDLEHRIGYQHFALEVADLPTFAGELAGRGGEPEGDVRLGIDHTRQLWIQDPDGNRIELHEYTPSSLQRRHGGLATDSTPA